MANRSANPPANLAWRRVGDYCHVTEYQGEQWALIVHAVHNGKSGWSGTNEWHLYEGNERTYPGSEGRWLCSAGRGIQLHKTKLFRAQKIAAWILANPDLTASLTMSQIHDLALGGKVP